MKFTKRAYVKVLQNCPEDEREDTTITLHDYEDANELNSIPVTLLYLLERYASVNSMDEFNVLELCLTAESFDLIGFVKTYRDMLSKTGDFWTPMKFITANPKPVDGIPPVPYCPRCGALICGRTPHDAASTDNPKTTPNITDESEIYKNNPDPPFCHNCGQRFKYVGQDQLAYKHQRNRADTPRTLKLKAGTQPTFDLAEFNQ